MCFISVAHFFFSSSQFLWDEPRDTLKYPKTKNGTEILKRWMLSLRIKIIWIKFQFHHYCLQCISVPNLTLKEVDGGKREGGKRVVSNRDAKCKLWRTNTTSSASPFFLASATLLTSLPSVFDLFVLKSFYSFFFICRRATGHESNQKKEGN